MTATARSLFDRWRGGSREPGGSTITERLQRDREKPDGGSRADRLRALPSRKPPSLAEIEQLANRALATIPPSLRCHLERVLIRVEDFPDQATRARLDLQSPYNLLGLYHGVPRTLRSATYPPPYPDLISLYRQPILLYWCSSDNDLEDVVRHVLIHEVGHHFGFSDADMERIEAAG